MTATMTSATKVTRCVLYLRISMDKAGDEHGVTNQRTDAARLAAARGWDIVAEYTDNDLSAYSGVRRPGYQAMMAAARRREFDAIVLFQTSRLWRNRAERAAGIKILQDARISVVATRGPSLDMTTAYGRGMAGLLGEFDTMEVEIKSERQQLANQADRDAGIRHNGPPAFMDAPGGRPAITWAADALLGGSTVSAVTREWTRRGLRPPQAPFGPLTADAWKRNSVTTILRNPAVAGLRAYTRRETGEDGKTRIVRTIVTDEHGEPVRLAGVEPVLDEQTWRAVVALLDAPGRKPAQGVRTMLGGLMRCVCGNTVQATTSSAGHQVYRCNPATRGTRPGPHAQQSAANVDDYVGRVMVARLSRPDAVGLVTPRRPDLTPLHREAAAIRANLDEMAADRALGLVTREQMIAATKRGTGRVAEIEAELAASASTSALAPFAAGQAQAVWDGLDRERRRAVTAALAEVTLHPAGRGARVFNPSTVQITWRTV